MILILERLIRGLHPNSLAQGGRDNNPNLPVKFNQAERFCSSSSKIIPKAVSNAASKHVQEVAMRGEILRETRSGEKLWPRLQRLRIARKRWTPARARIARSAASPLASSNG